MVEAAYADQIRHSLAQLGRLSAEAERARRAGQMVELAGHVRAMAEHVEVLLALIGPLRQAAARVSRET
jgi:hypothetical protein